MRMLTVALLALFAGSSAASAGEVAFTTKPATAKAGDKTTISFTVSAPTDVEVAVLAADGKVVRHLAAGVLGAKNPPPEPLKTGLSQSLEWDGKDDLGKPAAGGPFKVQVRAGMGVKFGRLIGGSPYTGEVGYCTGSPSTVATGDDGQLYVRMCASALNIGDTGPHGQIRQFDKNGAYVRTVLPYPPSTPPEKASAFKLIDAGDGLLTPANRSCVFPALYNSGRHIYHRIVNGCAVFVDSETNWNYPAAQVLLVKLDNSEPARAVTLIPDPHAMYSRGTLQLALSPDGRWAHSCDWCKAPGDKQPSAWPEGVVYRHDLAKPVAPPEKLYELAPPEPNTPAIKADYYAYTRACALDTDAKGNVLVCDMLRQEIVELSPEGKKLSATKVPWPFRVAAGRKSDALYVVSRKPGSGAGELLKISGRGAEAKVTARLPLKGRLGAGQALDESGANPVVWINGQFEVIRAEDRGAEFAGGENILNRDKNAIAFPGYITVDPEADLVYVADSAGSFGGNRSGLSRYSGETGEGGPIPVKGLDVAVGTGGLLYAWGVGGYDGPICRYTRDLKPAPLAASGKHQYGALGGRFGRGNSAGGIAVDLRGWVYIYHSIGGDWPAHVSAWDAEGKPVETGRTVTYPAHGKNPETKEPTLIGHLQDAGGGVRADAAGNIYVGQLKFPKGYTPPKGFEKDPLFAGNSGTVLKFGPKGGDRPNPGRDWWQHLDDPGLVVGMTGVLGAYPGLGPMQTGCVCGKPRFDLDGFGRLYLPNGFTFKVAVVDNAGNEVLKFGGYGNFDAQGPKSKEPKPEIPLGWPTAAGVSDKYIYVGDALNHRVVRADKTWAAEATCALP
jgi:hypothetical protein